MKLQSNKERSFGRMLDEKVPKEEIMRRLCITEAKFEKLKLEVERIRREMQG